MVGLFHSRAALQRHADRLGSLCGLRSPGWQKLPRMGGTGIAWISHFPPGFGAVPPGSGLRTGINDSFPTSGLGEGDGPGFPDGAAEGIVPAARTPPLREQGRPHPAVVVLLDGVGGVGRYSDDRCSDDLSGGVLSAAKPRVEPGGLHVPRQCQRVAGPAWGLRRSELGGWKIGFSSPPPACCWRRRGSFPGADQRSATNPFRGVRGSLVLLFLGGALSPWGARRWREAW